MDAFDLGRLNDHDFEEVCKDLFELVLEKRLEIFAPGKDDGVDLRYAAPVGTAPDLTIVQCKHWIKSKSSSLVRHIEKVERPKIVELAPDRYILATSTSLTKDGNDKLASSLAPFVKTSGDIYGLDEVVALLREHPEVVKRHLRLWLASSVVLAGMFNKDILERSATLVDEVDESLQVYAPNESFNRARELLEATRVCLITGSPGIGKSTLARVLAAYYVAENYELIEISEDVTEGFRAWSDDRSNSSTTMISLAKLVFRIN